MWIRAAAVGVLVAALVGCGGTKKAQPMTNQQLASDIATHAGLSSSLVCWTRTGKVGAMSAMGYTRICGLSRNRPTIFVRTGVKTTTGWCLVTPRLDKAPDCPL